ncbi:MAG: ECF transporter S component [Eubacterium sp.]|nr:ECF transporter S component [Eubacterium sp.]
MKTNTKQMTINSVLAAICATLAFLALSTQGLKITFESLPVLIGALLFGPLSGFAIGVLGTSIYQLLKFGITLTTPLWILPYAVYGIIVGAYAKSHNFVLNKKQTFFIVISGELLITALNTLSLYIDSHIYHYYSPALILGLLLPRIAICLAKAVAFSIIVPELIKPLRKISK